MVENKKNRQFMAKLTKQQELDKIHEQALIEFNEIQSTLRDERLQCLQDRRFYSIAGAQYEGPLSGIYENKPKIEVNKVHAAIIRIFNEYRNNRITVDFTDDSDSVNDDLASTLDGLYRADERYSVAQEAYDNAFEEAVAGGIGAWRLRTVYEDEEDPESDKQRIKIEPIFDADSCVFFDLNAKRQDKSDAKSCYVLTPMTRTAYIEEYGDDPTSWKKVIHQSEFDWCTVDTVYIAEYYRIEEKTETRFTFRTITGEEEKYTQSDFDNDENLVGFLASQGSVEISRKKYKTKKVRKLILSGGKVLEDLGHIAGKCIPIVIVYGKRWVVDNVERAMGHVRLAKDTQRLKNMQLSKLAEIAATSSIDKPILYPEQIAGHQQMWAEDNLKQFPALLINPIIDSNGNKVISGPVGMKTAPNIPPAMAALIAVTDADMQEVLGNAQQAEKVVSNISGKAVEMIQQRVDNQSYIFLDNFAKGMKRCGEVWLSIAKEIYTDDSRQMKTVNSEGETSTVKLMQPAIDEETGEVVYKNDLVSAKFSVNVDVGPSSSSKRAATVRALTGMIAITDDAETKQVLQAMALMNMEAEGIKDVRAYFRKKLVRMGVIEPTEEEAQELAAIAQSQQDPNAIFLQAAAEEATAKAAKARADTVKTVADAELSRAKTLETLSSVDISEQQNAMSLAEKMQGAIIDQSQRLELPQDQLQALSQQDVEQLPERQI